MANNPEDFAKHRIETTQKQLRAPGVIHSLGADASRRMLELSDRLYLPEIGTDRVAKLQEGGIPVVGLLPGDEIEVTGEHSDFSPEQRKSLSDKGVLPAVQEALENSLRPGERVVMDEASGGKTISRQGKYTGKSGTKWRVVGAPLIALNAEDDDEPGHDTALGHELVHAGQAEALPFTKETNRLSRRIYEETRAYHVQSALDTYLHSKDANTRAQRVESAMRTWLESGRQLKTEDDRKDFERFLRTTGVGGMIKKSIDV